MINNIFTIILSDNKVNNYTKILIILNNLWYYNDNYIPNKKILNICKKYNIKISIRNIQNIINELSDNKRIFLYYFGNKRYFKLCFYNNKKNKKEYNFIEEEEYNWL